MSNIIFISTDTTWSGTVDLTGKTVQIAAEAKLTISKGTTVRGGNSGAFIQSYGTLKAEGASDDYVKFENVYIQLTNKSSSNTTCFVDINFAEMKRLSDGNSGGIDVQSGSYGRLKLTNSKLEDFKSETMDLMEKGYSKTILSSNSEIKNNEKSNIKKCKKSFENLNNLGKNNKNIDIYGCENFIEEKLFYLI